MLILIPEALPPSPHHILALLDPAPSPGMLGLIQTALPPFAHHSLGPALSTVMHAFYPICRYAHPSPAYHSPTSMHGLAPCTPRSLNVDITWSDPNSWPSIITPSHPCSPGQPRTHCSLLPCLLRPPKFYHTRLCPHAWDVTVP